MVRAGTGPRSGQGPYLQALLVPRLRKRGVRAPEDGPAGRCQDWRAVPWRRDDHVPAGPEGTALRPHGHSRRVRACIAQAAADRKDRRCAPVVLRRLACPEDLAVEDAFPPRRNCAGLGTWPARIRSEEHTSELKSLMP